MASQDDLIGSLVDLPLFFPQVPFLQFAYGDGKLYFFRISVDCRDPLKGFQFPDRHSFKVWILNIGLYYLVAVHRSLIFYQEGERERIFCRVFLPRLLLPGVTERSIAEPITEGVLNGAVIIT